MRLLLTTGDMNNGKNRGINPSSIMWEQHVKEEFMHGYEQHADAIFRHCLFRVYDRERAKDLMQETFFKTWSYLAEGEKIDNLRAFLYRTATNLIIDESRKKKSLSLDELLEEGFSPADYSHEAMEIASSAKEIMWIVDELEPTSREVLLMRYINELSPKEIGSLLGESENTISVRIHRALKKAQKILEQKTAFHKNT